MKRRTVLGLVLLVAAAACYFAIIVARHGPPPDGDTTPLTDVTSALASGHLQVAAADDGLPNPPGYPLLAAPRVAAVPSLFGSPTWCLTPHRVAGLPKASDSKGANLAAGVNVCGKIGPSGAATDSLPDWYRSQGLLGVLGWLVLAAGAGRSCAPPGRTRPPAPPRCSSSSPSCPRRAAPSCSSSIRRTS